MGALHRGADFPFQAWLLRIAINLGKNHARQARKWRQAPLSVVESTGNGEVSPLESLERAERERMARQAVLELPRRQREVVVLRVDAGLPFAEVAATLGITENNAKVHFHHAAKRLKEIIARRMEEGGSDVRLP
jgi:RNA polymerase sigma-70 factor (ECF subfamily)